VNVRLVPLPFRSLCSELLLNDIPMRSGVLRLCGEKGDEMAEESW